MMAEQVALIVGGGSGIGADAARKHIATLLARDKKKQNGESLLVLRAKKGLSA